MSNSKRKCPFRALVGRIFDSTTKCIIWLILAFLFYMAIRILRGWESGLEDATGLFATVMASADAVVAFYIWKAKNENVIKLARPLEMEKDAIRKILNSTENESEDSE